MHTNATNTGVRSIYEFVLMLPIGSYSISIISIIGTISILALAL